MGNPERSSGSKPQLLPARQRRVDVGDVRFLRAPSADSHHTVRHSVGAWGVEQQAAPGVALPVRAQGLLDPDAALD
jgi:hypothetical protein